MHAFADSVLIAFFGCQAKIQEPREMNCSRYSVASLTTTNCSFADAVAPLVCSSIAEVAAGCSPCCTASGRCGSACFGSCVAESMFAGAGTASGGLPVVDDGAPNCSRCCTASGRCGSACFGSCVAESMFAGAGTASG